MEAKKKFFEASTSESPERSAENYEAQDMDPLLLATFMKNCMKLLHDGKVVEGLQEIIENCMGKIKTPLEQRVVRKLCKHKKKIGCEMRLTMQIGEYEIDQVILDLGSDEKLLPKQMWERMGRPTLQWSPIQLRMPNQQKIILMGHMYGVTVDIEGESALADFEVIETVDDNNPYPALLGVDCTFDMDAVINMKKRRMTFEKKALKVIVSLDPIEGACYTNPVCDYEEEDVWMKYKRLLCAMKIGSISLQMDGSHGIHIVPAHQIQMKNLSTGKIGYTKSQCYVSIL